LVDYEADWAALEASRNPFAVVVMAHLKTKETHKQPEARKTWRYHLTTMLYDQGYSEQDILELHNFLDWLMNLPEELEKQFQIELKAFEEARQMKYVTTIERMAEERGRVEERLTTQTEIALNMLRKNMALETIAEVTGLTIEQIQALQAQDGQDK
jgi:predicted transposase/invertase (TIGR01784 family)